MAPAGAIEWTKVHEAEQNETRYSLFIEEGNPRKICHVNIADNGKTATVVLSVDRHYDTPKFVTNRTQYFELVKNKQYWVVTKDVKSGSSYELGTKRKHMVVSMELSYEDLTWYFYEDFERAPIEARRILRSL